MAELIKAQRGMQDVLPGESHKHRFVEATLMDIASNFGFQEIRTPVLEATELFARGIGDTTDVVQKEMYTFNDKGGRSVTLRPEGTAGAARAFLEHGLFNEALPQKVCYIAGCYRYEKPQAGRLREHHQFGVEMFGAASPAADAELISLGHEIMSFFGLTDIHPQLNSIGCPNCRPAYHKALIDYFSARKEELCPTCQERLTRNPLRILDCKSPICSEFAKDAPVGLAYLCEECETHFAAVRGYLDAMQIAYTINPRIVRGLDYYTKTVFEFVAQGIGAQGTVFGGGRYDGLLEQLGGPKIPALGFGMGLERLLLAMQEQNIALPQEKACELYIASIGDAAGQKAAQLCYDLRTSGIPALFDIVGRSVKAQMKYAGKLGVNYTMVLGDDDLAAGKATLKNMQTGEQSEMDLANFAEDFLTLTVQQATQSMQAAVSADALSALDILKMNPQ